MQNQSLAVTALVLALIILAFIAGANFDNVIGNQKSNEIITTTTTLTSIVSTSMNGSQFVLTEEIFVEPQAVDDVCIGRVNYITVYSEYFSPPIKASNDSHALLITTTSTLSEMAPTLYENATIAVNVNGTSFICTEINAHYNVPSHYIGPPGYESDCFCV